MWSRCGLWKLEAPGLMTFTPRHDAAELSSSPTRSAGFYSSWDNGNVAHFRLSNSSTVNAGATKDRHSRTLAGNVGA